MANFLNSFGRNFELWLDHYHIQLSIGDGYFARETFHFGQFSAIITAWRSLRFGLVAVNATLASFEMHVQKKIRWEFIHMRLTQIFTLLPADCVIAALLIRIIAVVEPSIKIHCVNKRLVYLLSNQVNDDKTTTATNIKKKKTNNQKQRGKMNLIYTLISFHFVFHQFP